MGHNVVDLPWLPPAPEDFTRRCRALGGDSTGHDLQWLAGHRLSASGAAAFRRGFDRACKAGANLDPLVPFRLAVLSNATFDFVADEIPAAAARHGVAVQLVVGDFDQVMQAAADPDSAVNRSRPDAVLLAIDHRWLGLEGFAPADTERRIEDALQRLYAAADAVRANAGAPVILQLLPTPGPALFGSFERSVPGSAAHALGAINRAMVERTAETGDYLLDVDGLAARIGTDRWFDPVQWAAYKLPFAADCNAAYADLLGRLLGAIRGRARKCLVLDLDNTLWGGVIGDDGIDNLTLGPGSPTGEAFTAVQKTALALRDRGVVLAVASKNDDATARAPFRDHAEMLIRESDLAVFQADWTDKPSNVEAIAATLNLGLDAMVFLDDNPAERAQMRAALPAVAVPELPSDPAWFPWFLLSAGYFEAVGFSDEDRLRAASYAANAQRADVRAGAHDLGDYLGSLSMELTAQPFDPRGRARITQLINKTNQFNLLTRRLTDAQVAELEAAPDVVALQFRLRDRFGDMGMIGVLVCRQEGAVGRIEHWLMSCRVLGRQVERAMLLALREVVASRGVNQLLGRYEPTAKNGVVRGHYDALGFSLVSEQSDGAREYKIDLDAVDATDLPLKLST